ncbi:threonine synthase [Mesoterricola sediminis]|uniref:Threonine synthase n=1 Tax=Mesoterricola sediminis TaxID=2927980 RepID=A0AA48HA96_9BACT|nr:threonine synthase [Mesoterricola sediminis]BDU78778.1 threonine synthase [Mesoterricola sediminis]
MTPFVYRCTDCGRTYSRDEVRYLCPTCGESYRPGIPLTGVLEAVFDYPAIHGRFQPGRPDWGLFCAVEDRYHPPLPVGNTPMARLDRTAAELGLGTLWVKNDGLNPSGSLKDRASFLVAAEAARLGIDLIVAASTGNAASALAAVCASTGQKALIFVPEKAPKAKLVQMVLYGATVVPVKGTYDDAFRLSLDYTAKRGGLNRNTAYHPLTLEGKKTAGLEIWAQAGFRVPDAIFVSVGDGVILGGVAKAFLDLNRAGLIDRLPRLIGVQADTSDAIHRYVETGVYSDAANPTTRADSISVTCPSNAHGARRAILESGGLTLTVTDEEILSAQATLASRSGIFTEPAGATAFAGLLKLQASSRALPADASAVILATGNGLKDVEAPLSRISIPPAVEPVLEALSL